MLSECCKLSSTPVTHNISEVNDTDLELPIIVNLEADCNKRKHSNLVPLLPHMGVAFLLLDDNKSNHSLQMLKSLFTTWPVLVLTLVLSLFAGIIAWSLVSREVIIHITS